MLRTKSFHWTEEALEAFDQLKVAMTMTSILTLLDCTIPFVVECDAFNSGIGTVLQNMGTQLHIIALLLLLTINDYLLMKSNSFV